MYFLQNSNGYKGFAGIVSFLKWKFTLYTSHYVLGVKTLRSLFFVGIRDSISKSCGVCWLNAIISGTTGPNIIKIFVFDSSFIENIPTS